jgi:hypothetical protein
LYQVFVRSHFRPSSLIDVPQFLSSIPTTMSTWIQTQYSHQPTVDGLAETLAILPRPQTLAGIAGIQDRWKVAVLAMLVHQMHNDGNHTSLNHGFHSLTSTHYRTGASSYNSSQQTSQDQRMDNWRARSEHTKTILSLIFDLVR